MSSKYRDIVDKLKKQLSIGQRRLITIQVAQPIGYKEGCIDGVPLQLSPEDLAARAALREALAVTDADLIVWNQRICSEEDYAAVLESGLPKVVSIQPLV